MTTSPHPRGRCAPAATPRGFTIAEMLIVVLIVGILAVAVVPTLGVSGKKLEVAGQEVGNALRFALSESRRTGGFVLVDAGTSPGRVLVVNSDVTGARGSDVVDPVTKRAMDIDVASSAFSTGVQMSPRFIGPSGAHAQLLIGPGPVFWAAQGSVVMGTLQPGSGIDLALGTRTITVSFDSVTGRVVIP
jgi:prepilin-type N-terminal cleavage/methylation domain-containing protein